MSKLKIIKDDGIQRNAKGQVVKGQVLNPTGRPRRVADLAAKCGEYTDEIIETLLTIVRDKKASRRDKMEASKMLLDRGYGRPSQSMTISGDPEGMPVATTTLTPEQYADIVAAAKEVDDDV